MKFKEICKKWWPTALTLAAVLWITLAPDPAPDTSLPIFPGADKIIHAIMMGGLTGAIFFDLQRHHGIGWRPTPRYYIWIGLAMAAFSGLDEITQSAMGLGRTGDIWDFVADAAGIIVAMLTAPAASRWVLSRGRKVPGKAG